VTWQSLGYFFDKIRSPLGQQMVDRHQACRHGELPPLRQMVVDGGSGSPHDSGCVEDLTEILVVELPSSRVFPRGSFFSS
jgi:hypothetical protein